MKVHCFHGFLGSPSDFDFLGGGFDTVAYDMKELCGLDKQTAFSSLAIAPGDALVGYSFGARFALELMTQKKCSRLIMLAGHAGLRDEEKKARLKIEANFLDKVQELDFDSFIKWWNELELFRHDPDIAPRPWSKKQMQRMFLEYGLSRQKYCLDFVRENREKITWVAGSKDTKYYNYTKENVEPLGVNCVYLNAGHRLLGHAQEVGSILEKVLEKI